MFNVTTNPRKYNVANIFELAGTMVRNGWLVTSVLALLKGRKEVCNIPEVLAEILDTDKKYTVGKDTYTGEQVIGLSEAWVANNKGKFGVTVEGRHRAVAAFLATVIGKASLDVQTIEISADQAETIALMGNGANDFVTKMANSEKLSSVVALMVNGIYKSEGDLPFKRGMNQKLWYQGTLVSVHGLDPELAIQLDKEKARKASKATDVAGAVKEFLSVKAGNEQKVLSGSKLRELQTLAKTANADHPITQLLKAICEAHEIGAKQIIVAELGAKK
jgi:hypothetical protein